MRNAEESSQQIVAVEPVESLLARSGLTKIVRTRVLGRAISMCVSFVFLLKMLPVFTGSLFGVALFGAARCEVTEFMAHPVDEGIVIDVAVGVDEDSSAGQVGEHGAGIAGGYMEVKGSSGVDVLPVGHEDDSQWENFGVHDLNLSPQQGFLLWSRPNH